MRMFIEKERGCGYRKVGAMYLVGEGIPVNCDRLPFALLVCPTCGAGVKFSRGFTWIDWYEYAGIHKDCRDPYLCPICVPPKESDRYGLLWVGKRYYTPESFVQEAIEMGVSKRIAQIPKNLELGRTRILLAHPEACENICPDNQDCDVKGKPKGPGIFYSFIPQRVEMIITKEQSEDKEYIEKLKRRGITPVVIEG
jgi:hypothetical protein